MFRDFSSTSAINFVIIRCVFDFLATFLSDIRHCSNPCSSVFSREASYYNVICSGFCFAMHWFAASEHHIYGGLVLNLSLIYNLSHA